MLKDERYTGVQILLKQKRGSLSAKTKINCPEDEWLKFPNSHEAIVSEEIFRKAQASFAKPAKTNKPRSVGYYADIKSPYAGKVKCGCCGYSAYFKRSKNSYYMCRSLRINAENPCFTGKLLLSDLNAIVLNTIKIEAKKQRDNLNKRMAVQKIGKNANAEELKSLSSRRSTLEQRMVSLYEDFADNRMSKETYISTKAKCADELATLEAKCAELENLISTNTAVYNPETENEPLQKRIISSKKVTEEIASLIESITIYDKERIEIRFSFGDA
jgi:hypothetical protein